MRYLLLLTCAFLPLLGICQAKTPSIVLADSTKEELLHLAEDLFNVEARINFNVTSRDLKATFEEMQDGKVYDTAYLNTLLQQIEQDTLNPMHWNSVAEYYAKNGQPELANLYYNQAINKIDIKHFKGDSAALLSFRGLVKSNLNDPSYLNDFRKSIDINPNDSIALFFYPLVLISSSHFDEARDVLEKMLEQSNANVPDLYLYLTMTELWDGIKYHWLLTQEDDSLKKAYQNKAYTEIIDYRKLDAYAMRYKNNDQVRVCRIMADLLGLVGRLSFFEIKEYKVVFSYTENEKKKLNEIISTLNQLEQEKKINAFTFHKCLGIAHLLLQQWEKSVEHWQQAITLFPEKKRDPDFQPIDCYDAITAIYYQTSDHIQFRASAEAKMASEKERIATIDELMLIAFNHFQSGELKEAEEYCRKARIIKYNHFDAVRLLAHLSFLKGYYKQAQDYCESASKCVTNDLDHMNLIVQFAIYHLHFGEIQEAREKIEMALQIGGKNNCLTCDALMRIVEAYQK